MRPSLTLEKLRQPHGSVPGNPLLAEPLYLAKYIERMGTGTRDMIRLCRELGLREPEFSIADGFVTKLWRPATAQATTQVTTQATPQDKSAAASILSELAGALGLSTPQATPQAAAQVASLLGQTAEAAASTTANISANPTWSIARHP